MLRVLLGREGAQKNLHSLVHLVDRHNYNKGGKLCQKINDDDNNNNMYNKIKMSVREDPNLRVWLR